MVMRMKLWGWQIQVLLQAHLQVSVWPSSVKGAVHCIIAQNPSRDQEKEFDLSIGKSVIIVRCILNFVALRFSVMRCWIVICIITWRSRDILKSTCWFPWKRTDAWAPAAAVTLWCYRPLDVSDWMAVRDGGRKWGVGVWVPWPDGSWWRWADEGCWLSEHSPSSSALSWHASDSSCLSSCFKSSERQFDIISWWWHHLWTSIREQRADGHRVLKFSSGSQSAVIVTCFHGNTANSSC